MTDQTPVLRIQNIEKSYGDNKVLKGVSLELNRGGIKVIIGPSGGGKSTLLHCINFLVGLDEGRIYLNGKEIVHTRKRELTAYRQKVGMIFQDFNLFDHLNALHNVLIGPVRVKKIPKSEATERAVAELERVGLRDHMTK